MLSGHQLPSNRIHQATLIIYPHTLQFYKRTNWFMKKQNPPKKGIGFGFGDAMFAVKDLTDDYGQFGGSSPPVKSQPEVQKNPIARPAPVAAPKKGVMIGGTKPQSRNQPKTTVVQQRLAQTQPGAPFKVSAGKEFSSIKTIQLFQLPSTAGVYELSSGKSLTQWEYNVFCDGVPANAIVEKPEVSFSFEAEDIKQGNLGNCYFVSALAALAPNPWIFQSRIPAYKTYGPGEKMFKVFLFESGKCIEVMVENLFPNVFCKPVGNDISPMILEKAYAQVYGNFDVIHMGHSTDALRDLTGAPAVYLDFKNKEMLRAGIKQAFLNKFAVVIASKSQVDQSLSPKHSYIVLGHQLVGAELFLRLRDPRGHTKASFYIPEKLRNEQKGNFWIGEKDLEKNFEVISICRATKGYNYYFKTFSDKQLCDRTAAVLLRPSRSTKAYISIHQKHKKFFDEKFSYDIIRILLAEVEVVEGNLKVVRTEKVDFNAQQVCCIECNLESKQYVVLGQIGKKKAKFIFPKQLLTLSVYCDNKDVEFSQVTGNIDLSPFLSNYIVSNKTDFKESQTQQGLRKFQGPLFGYICQYYENHSGKQVIEETQFTVKNVEISEKRILLAHNQKKLVMHAIGPENNCSHQCSMKTKTFYK